jgi:hypothetical protein
MVIWAFSQEQVAIVMALHESGGYFGAITATFVFKEVYRRRYILAS